MSEIDIEVIESKDLTSFKLNSLIDNRKSFAITGITDMSTVVKNIESSIEAKALSCRVYTENRSAGLAGLAIPTGVTQVTGLFTAIGVGLHNLVTYSPDYELGKNYFANRLNVMFKK